MTTRLFYQNANLSVEQGDNQARSIMRLGRLPIAELLTKTYSSSACLLATTQNFSVFRTYELEISQPLNYSAYGGTEVAPPTLSYLGENLDISSKLYLLGNGHRPYSTSLMRFLAPDSHSPFMMGGINSYCYCAGDPINFFDPSGKVRVPLLPTTAHRIPRRSNNPTLRRSARLHRRENLFRAKAEKASAEANNAQRGAQILAAKVEEAKRRLENVSDPIQQQRWQKAIETIEQQRAVQLNRSGRHLKNATRYSAKADELRDQETDLLIEEVENLPPSPVSDGIFSFMNNNIQVRQRENENFANILLRLGNNVMS
jgi:RHS repeat-associated protein